MNTVVSCGCDVPNCPRTTGDGASERVSRVVFVPDATSGACERGLKDLDNVGVAVADTAAVIERFA